MGARRRCRVVRRSSRSGGNRTLTNPGKSRVRFRLRHGPVEQSELRAERAESRRTKREATIGSPAPKAPCLVPSRGRDEAGSSSPHVPREANLREDAPAKAVGVPHERDRHHERSRRARVWAGWGGSRGRSPSRPRGGARARVRRVGREGVEPSSLGVKARCSAD